MEKIANVKQNNTLDLLKFVATILIIGSHSLPIFRYDYYNFIYGQWLFRFCVPLFFLSSGYFFEEMNCKHKKIYIGRIVKIYLLSLVVYAPLLLKNSENIVDIFRNCLFGWRHLWYLSALQVSLIIIYLMKLNNKKYNHLIILTALVLITMGAFFDEYFKLFHLKGLERISKFINVGGGVRHFLFFALPLLLIGKVIQNYKDFICTKMSKNKLIYTSFFFAVLSLGECIYLRNHVGDMLTCDITFFNWIPAVFIFILTFKYHIRIKQGRRLRKLADYMYILHIWVIVLVQSVYSNHYMSKFMVILIVTLLVSGISLSIFEKLGSRKGFFLVRYFF